MFIKGVEPMFALVRDDGRIHGHYATREHAETVLEMLKRRGVKATIKRLVWK